jgi:hypothetical protein
MRLSLLTATLLGAVVLIMPPAISAGTVRNAEFVSGTLTTIPANTVGSLDVDNSTELTFHYGQSVFTLPFQNITNTQVVEPNGRHLWKVPVPKLGRSSRFLTITYSEGDKSRMLTFKASTDDVTDMVGTINQRRKDPKGASAKASKTEEDWWGDRYWRTNRNKAKWPNGDADPQGVPAAGTKLLN